MGFNTFLAILFGLWVGDYFFQPESMAIHKGDRTIKGLWICILHCLIYTVVTLVFLYGTWVPIAILVGMFLLKNYLSKKYSEPEERQLIFYPMYLIASLAWIHWTWIVLLVAVVIFLSHYFIDRYSLAMVWLRVIKGRDFVADKDRELPDNWSKVTTSFACITYKEVDNAMHIVLLWYALKALSHYGLFLMGSTTNN